MTWQIRSDSISKTIDYGRKIGQQLKGGEVIELLSDVGGGKTTFTHGLAQGIGSNDHVSSPTFTISKRYKGKNLTIEHFDFYRLSDAGLIKNELADYIGLGDTVVVVEWPEIIEDVLPSDRITIKLAVLEDNIRLIEVTVTDKYNYINDASPNN